MRRIGTSEPGFCLTTGANEIEKSGVENVPGSLSVNRLNRSPVRGIGTSEPKSCLTTGLTEIEMNGDMIEANEMSSNGEKNGMSVNEKKDDVMLGEEKGEKSKNVRMLSAVMMREMQIAESVVMIQERKKEKSRIKKR